MGDFGGDILSHVHLCQLVVFTKITVVFFFIGTMGMWLWEYSYGDIRVCIVLLKFWKTNDNAEQVLLSSIHLLRVYKGSLSTPLCGSCYTNSIHFFLPESSLLTIKKCIFPISRYWTPVFNKRIIANISIQYFSFPSITQHISPEDGGTCHHNHFCVM